MPNQQRREMFFVAKHPESRTAYYTLAGPFDIATWILLMIAMLSMALLLAFSASLKYFDSLLGNPLQSFLAGFGILITESLPTKQLSFQYLWKLKHICIALIIWLPTCYFISLAYRSNLLASLCRQELEDPIDTYEDVLERNMKAYVPLGTSAGRLLNTSPNPTVRHFYLKAVTEVRFVKGGYPQDIREEMLSGKAVISGIKEITHKTSGRIAKHTLISGNLHCGYYHRKNDFTMTRAKMVLDTLVEIGIKNKIVDGYIWRMSKPERVRLRSQDSVNRSEPLTLSHFYSLFILHGAFIVLVSSIALVWDCNFSFRSSSTMHCKRLKQALKECVRILYRSLRCLNRLLIVYSN